MAFAVETVRRFRGLRALVIGDAMLDTYLEGRASRICSEGPVPVVRKTAEHHVPGGAANTAMNLRALGAEVHLLGVVGRDEAGATLRACLRAAGVDETPLIEDSGVPTLHKLRILADGQYVVRFDDDGTRTHSTAARAQLLGRLDELFGRSDLVVVSDYCYGIVADDLIERLRVLRQRRPCVLLVDSKRLQRFAGSGATVVTPNLLEARLFAGADGQESDADDAGALDMVEAARLARLVRERMAAEHVALTLSAQGALLVSQDGTERHILAHPVAQAGVAGAGDTFAAALGLALAVGCPLEEAARIGVDAAGLAVTKRWTSVVTAQELLQRVSLRENATGHRARVPAGRAGARNALAQTLACLAADRQAGKTIVFTNGVFDILHAGHVALLRQAKALGDVLVVGVNSDESARRLKGRNRPINSERDRLALVAALDSVDHAVLFDEDTPSSAIRALRPHVHVKGGDYGGQELPEAAAVREVGGRVEIVPLLGAWSTSTVIDRIVALAANGSGEHGGQHA